MKKESKQLRKAMKTLAKEAIKNGGAHHKIKDGAETKIALQGDGTYVCSMSHAHIMTSVNVRESHLVDALMDCAHSLMERIRAS